MSLFLHSSNADESAVQTPLAPLCRNRGAWVGWVGVDEDEGRGGPITMYLLVWPYMIVSPLLPNCSAAKRLSKCVCGYVCVCVRRGWLALSARLSLWGKGCLKGRSWQRSRPLSSLSKYCLCVTDSRETARWHSAFSHSATPLTKKKPQPQDLT